MHIKVSFGNLLPLLAATTVGLAVTAKAAAEKARPEQQPSGAPSSVRQMQQDFLKLKFGMFIHFNMATYKGVQWVEDYHPPADFNPGGRIDTDAWADAAKSAGMKYAVLTAKHVSGFCLWDSQYTDYKVTNTPYGRDLLTPFVEEHAGPRARRARSALGCGPEWIGVAD